jgi:diadenosine tetraphosphate (Ap4A) HIT family hydrolase
MQDVGRPPARARGGPPPRLFRSARTMTTNATFTLHPRLAQDTVEFCELPLSRALVMNDANFPWLILVPRVPAASEIIDLDEGQQAQLMREITLLGTLLRAATHCDKLNVAAIGNVVPQLHVHVVARRRSDPAWPRPVWGAVPARPYGAAELERLLQTLRSDPGFMRSQIA